MLFELKKKKMGMIISFI